MKYCFDLDGVICHGLPYSEAVPDQNIIHVLHSLKREGNTIIIHTARRMNTHNGNVGLVIKDIAKLTLEQLELWNVPYDEIYFGKPAADFYVDDKAINIKDF